LAILLGFGLCVGFSAYLLPRWSGVLAAFGLWIGYLVVAEYVFSEHDQWLPVTTPFLQTLSALLVSLIAHYVITRREETFLSDAFRRYVHVSPELSDTRRRVFGTVLFADIERFTAIGEESTPEKVVDLLDEYFETVARTIGAHHGEITQYQGDAVLAVFNVTEADPDHAIHAVLAALEIQDVLREKVFSDGRKLRSRMGINTGWMVAGAVGPPDKVTFTVHGDDVNLAARLEALNKAHGTRILISGATLEHLGDRFNHRQIGELKIRGKRRAITVLEVLGHASSGAPGPEHRTEESSKSQFLKVIHDSLARAIRTLTG
jgi:class 3 adenylate cyclase